MPPRHTQKELAEALTAADTDHGAEIAILTPFKIGTTNFLMVDQTGGTESCRYFTVVAQLSSGWRNIWELPTDHLRCSLWASPKIQFHGPEFSLWIPKATVRNIEPHIYPAEKWTYRWTGKEFDLVQAPAFYRATRQHQQP